MEQFNKQEDFNDNKNLQKDINQKVAEALARKHSSNHQNFQGNKCPLKCWDIFSMLKKEVK